MVTHAMNILMRAGGQQVMEDRGNNIVASMALKANVPFTKAEEARQRHAA